MTPDEERKARIAATKKAWDEANKEKIAEYHKKWYEANKEQRSAQNKEWYENNKERKAASRKAWRSANRDKANKYSNDYHAKNKDECNRKRRERKLLANFGITSEEYDQMLEQQNYKCKLCKADSCSSGNRFAVDHIHDMKMRGGEMVDVNKGNADAIRGLLCSACNTGLGKFKDDPDLLIAAAHYIQENRIDYDS